ncbi:F-box/LRR-repeat protein 8 [Trichomycterus rosablanca]|uniref:F-box/LRR-repeat protein 8 n=1 Tax=Trichomycterus rosablanca TaxID=2290929 RepID=UPI002F3569CD
MDLPEEILAHIFSFLSLKDRYIALTVCKAWANAMTCPAVWTHTEIRCESGTCMPHLFSNRLPLVKHLKLSVSMTEPINRRSGLWVIQQALASGSGQLNALCVSCVGTAPLFYSGQDLLQGLMDVLTDGSKLTMLDLRGVPFTLNDSFVKSIALLCPTLQSIFINNSSLVCRVVAQTVREMLKLCPALSSIGLFQASLSQDVLKDLLVSERPSLKQLELHCERSVKYVPPLNDQIWQEVSRRHPCLRVDLELDHTLPDRHIRRVLYPSIPVRQLHLHTWTCLLHELHQVTLNYAATLEVLGLQTCPSLELNKALIHLATQCTKLCEVHCYCVVSQEVIAAFCTHCPDLHRYTLKTFKEPHPWTCTLLK